MVLKGDLKLKPLSLIKMIEIKMIEGQVDSILWRHHKMFDL